MVNINQTSLPTHVHTVLMSNLPDTASASKVQFYQPTAMLSFLSRLQGRNRTDRKWTASVTVHIFFLRSFKNFLGSAYICVIMHDIFIFSCLLKWRKMWPKVVSFKNILYIYLFYKVQKKYSTSCYRALTETYVENIWIDVFLLQGTLF